MRSKSQAIKKEKLKESPVCFVCISGFKYTLELHHILPIRHGGEDTHENTVLLCPNCHSLFHFIISDRCGRELGEDLTLEETVDLCTNNDIEHHQMLKLTSVWVSESLKKVNEIQEGREGLSHV